MLRLRQIALVASDLEQAERELSEPLDLALCHRDPGLIEFGLHNALFPIGDRFLEIVSPLEEGTTAGRLLEKRHGDGGYMVMFQVDDLAAARRRLDRLGTRVVYVAKGDGITGLHIHPKDMPGAIVSIDESDEPAQWPWAGMTWQDQEGSEVVSDLVGAVIQVEDPAEAAAVWARVLDRPVTSNTQGELVIEVDDGTIRFVPVTDGRGPGVAGIDVVGVDRLHAGRSRSVLGVTIDFQ